MYVLNKESNVRDAVTLPLILGNKNGLSKVFVNIFPQFFLILTALDEKINFH